MGVALGPDVDRPAEKHVAPLLLLLGATSESHCKGGMRPALPRLSLSSNLLLRVRCGKKMVHEVGAVGSAAGLAAKRHVQGYE